MARISGVDLPKNKKVLFGLQYIFGIGRTLSAEILLRAEVNPDKKVADLTDEEIAAIQKEVSANYTTEGELRKEVTLNIKRLMEIGSYRGIRHRKGLPVRGQNTRNNARTRKGKAKAIAAKKK